MDMYSIVQISISPLLGNFDFQRRQGHVTETVEMGYFVNALRIPELFVIFRI